jgi:hypothetical protein
MVTSRSVLELDRQAVAGFLANDQGYERGVDIMTDPALTD